jgi:hypothetical protein
MRLTIFKDTPLRPKKASNLLGMLRRLRDENMELSALCREKD